MQLEERTVGDVTVVKVTGDITLSSGGDVLLKDKVQSLLQQGKKKLLLDLGSVAYVDSGGLGQLVQCNVTASKNGGAFLSSAARVAAVAAPCGKYIRFTKSAMIW